MSRQPHQDANARATAAALALAVQRGRLEAIAPWPPSTFHQWPEVPATADATPIVQFVALAIGSAHLIGVWPQGLHLQAGQLSA